MTKKFVPILCKKKVLRLFQPDIKKIYYMTQVSHPSIPKFEEKVYNDDFLIRKNSISL